MDSRATFLHVDGYRAEVRLEDGTVLYWEVLPQWSEPSVRPIDFAEMLKSGAISLT